MENSVLDLSIVRFPVITFSNNRQMYFGRKRDDIEICSKIALKNGFYEGMRIIDADGIEYKIKDAAKVRTVGPLWGYNIFLNQKLRVKLYLGKAGDVVSLDSLKMQILKIMKSDMDFWDSDGMIEKKINFINNASSYFEIIKSLSDGFYLKYQ